MGEARSRARLRCGLARITVPRWSTARTPSSIAVRMASVRPRSRAISATRSCSWSPDWLMMWASSPSSSSRRTLMRADRLPVRELPGGVHDLAQRAGERRREEERQEPGGDEREAEGESGRPPQIVPGRLDLGAVAREARHAHDGVAGPDRHRDVQELGPDGRAPALRPGHPARERLLDLRSVGVILERGELGARDRGVAEHAPVTRDHRDPRLDVARRLVDHGVEARRAERPGRAHPRRPGPSAAPRRRAPRRSARGPGRSAGARPEGAGRGGRARPPPPPS